MSLKSEPNMRRATAMSENLNARDFIKVPLLTSKTTPLKLSTPSPISSSE